MVTRVQASDDADFDVLNCIVCYEAFGLDAKVEHVASSYV